MSTLSCSNTHRCNSESEYLTNQSDHHLENIWGELRSTRCSFTTFDMQTIRLFNFWIILVHNSYFQSHFEVTVHNFCMKPVQILLVKLISILLWVDLKNLWSCHLLLFLTLYSFYQRYASYYFFLWKQLFSGASHENVNVMTHCWFVGQWYRLYEWYRSVFKQALMHNTYFIMYLQYCSTITFSK